MHCGWALDGATGVVSGVRAWSWAARGGCGGVDAGEYGYLVNRGFTFKNLQMELLSQI